MNLSTIPGNESHLILSGTNAFGYIPTKRAAHYVVHVDSSGASEKPRAKHAKQAYTTGYTIYGFSDKRKLNRVPECFGVGVFGTWQDMWKSSSEFEKHGLWDIFDSLTATLPGVADGSSSITFKCDSRDAVKATSELWEKFGGTGRVSFAWEKGHNGNPGNVLADVSAGRLRESMRVYGTLDPVQVEDVLHVSLSGTTFGKTMQKSIFSAIGNLVKGHTLSDRDIFISIPSRGKTNWRWCTSGGFDVTTKRNGDDYIGMLERIIYEAKAAHPNAEKFYVVSACWDNVSPQHPILSWLYRECNAVVLGGRAWGHFDALEMASSSAMAKKEAENELELLAI